MKSRFFSMGVKAGQVDRHHVRVAVAIGTLLLLAIGAGAPTGSSGFG